MVKRTPFPLVLQILEEKGYTALITEKEYKGIIHPFPGLCPKKHECNISVSELKKGKGCCKKCGNESRNTKLKKLHEISFDKVLEAAHKNGYKLLICEEDYKGKETKIPSLCPKLHNCDVIVKRMLKNENCCKKCGDEKRSIQLAIPFAEVLNILNEVGYKIFISENEYKGAKHSYPGMCSKQHNCNVCPAQIKRGLGCCKPCGVEKYHQTCLSLYGVKCPNQNKEIYKRWQETCLKNHGVSHPMQNPEVFQKWQNSCFSTKEYIFPSGKNIKFQGYENFCFDDLLFIEDYMEDDIITSYTTGECKLPIIWYNGQHRYFPDIFIPKKNLIIEVKSRYTFNSNKEINLLKLKACIDAGYQAEIRIYDEKGNIEEIIREA